jgi:hypothetical protein
VRVYATGTRTLLGTQLMDTGSGYNSQNDMPVHFGLAEAQRVDVEVIWPARGRRRLTRIRNVQPSRFAGSLLIVKAP